MASTIFTKSELHSLERIGDILLPRHGELPAFSELGCIEHIDSIAQYAPADDIASLKLVLRLLSWAPKPALRWLVRACTRADEYFAPMATLLRLLNIAFRGLILTLYYSGKAGPSFHGKNPLELIEFSINRVPK